MINNYIHYIITSDGWGNSYNSKATNECKIIKKNYNDSTSFLFVSFSVCLFFFIEKKETKKETKGTPQGRSGPLKGPSPPPPSCFFIGPLPRKFAGERGGPNSYEITSKKKKYPCRDEPLLFFEYIYSKKKLGDVVFPKGQP